MFGFSSVSASGASISQDQDGTSITTNGKTYHLPSYVRGSLDVHDGKIFLNGKLWNDREKDGEFVATTYEFVLTEGYPSTIRVIGVQTVKVSGGDCYRATLIVKGRDPIGVAEPGCIRVESGDDSTLDLVFPQVNLDTEQISFDRIGRLEISDLDLPNAEIKAKVRGDVTLAGLRVDEIEVGVTSGTLSLVNGDIGHNARLKVVSGSVNVRGGTCPRMVIDSVSGNVHVKFLTGECLDIVTVSGSVHADEVKGQTMGVQTVSGSVHLVNADMGAIQVKTVSGSLNGSGSLKPRFQTISGRNRFVVQ